MGPCVRWIKLWNKSVSKRMKLDTANLPPESKYVRTGAGRTLNWVKMLRKMYEKPLNFIHDFPAKRVTLLYAFSSLASLSRARVGKLSVDAFYVVVAENACRLSSIYIYLFINASSGLSCRSQLLPLFGGIVFVANTFSIVTNVDTTRSPIFPSSCKQISCSCRCSGASSSCIYFIFV